MVTNEPRSSEPTNDAGSYPPRVESPVARRVTVDTAELAPLRSWLDEQLAPVLDDDDRKMLLVAVTEAVTNGIEAHRRIVTDQPIHVTVDGSAQLVTVEDRGGGLASGQVDQSTIPDPSAQRGRGLLIIQSIRPNARFVQTDSGTRVELPFRS